MLTGEMRELILTADAPALVFWRGDDIDLVFLMETNAEEDAAFTEKIKAQRLKFAGVFAMRDGQAQCKSASPEAVPVMIGATGAYARRIAEKIRAAEQAPRGDSVDWLEKLFALPDTRTEFGPG